MCEDPYPDSKSEKVADETPKKTVEKLHPAFDIPENGGSLDGFNQASPQVARFLRDLG